MPTFLTTAKDLFFSRNDAADPRRGERTRAIDSVEDLAPGFILAGYPDDEGIRNNGGRPGAAEAPDAIRKFLYRMVASSAAVYDLGNLDLKPPLKDRHEAVRKAVHSSLTAGHRWIGLGGGHDYGYADGAGFLDFVKSKRPGEKPLIINFDAHLDVRPVSAAISSGTPFFRLKQLGIDFDFVEIGIQRQCNSEAHLNWCEEHGATVLKLEDYWQSGLSLHEFTTNRLGDLLLQRRPCYLSVDIDAFAWPYAIGSSQSWPTGLEPKEFWPVFELLIARLNVLTLGIYETSPPLDFDNGTAKLSALIADTYLRKAQP